ncbi:hypothetical protein BT63DRAFT_410192 [Microthyrium microscopicum]|uniref:Uncharacterized protein n=1 Tax=Microthyrium microscopicum TaxID=703497 RepID=A0A6A6ULN6_9PEZI|nr:hypothetical protein BT63DRAFT_410192 [Microthyrium microscopicum]
MHIFAQIFCFMFSIIAFSNLFVAATCILPRNSSSSITDPRPSRRNFIPPPGCPFGAGGGGIYRDPPPMNYGTCIAKSPVISVAVPIHVDPFDFCLSHLSAVLAREMPTAFLVRTLCLRRAVEVIPFLLANTCQYPYVAMRLAKPLTS